MNSLIFKYLVGTVLAVSPLLGYSVVVVPNKPVPKKAKKVKAPVKYGWVEFNLYPLLSKKEVDGTIYNVIKTVVNPVDGSVEYMFIKESSLVGAMILNNELQLTLDTLVDSKVFKERDFFALTNKELSLENFNDWGQPGYFHHFHKSEGNVSVNPSIAKFKNELNEARKNKNVVDLGGNHVFGRNAFNFKFFIKNEFNSGKKDKGYFNFYEYKDDAILSDKFKDFYFVEYSSSPNSDNLEKNSVIFFPKELMALDNIEDLVANGLTPININRDVSFFFAKNNNLVLSFHSQRIKNSESDVLKSFNQVRENFLNIIKSSQNIYSQKALSAEGMVKASPVYIGNFKPSGGYFDAIIEAKDFPWGEKPVIKEGQVSDYLGIVKYKDLDKLSGEIYYDVEDVKFFHRKYLPLFDDILYLNVVKYMFTTKENLEESAKHKLVKIYNTPLIKETMASDSWVRLNFDVDKIKKNTDDSYTAYIPSVLNEDGMYHEVKIPFSFLVSSSFPVDSDIKKENPSKIIVPIDLFILGHYGNIRKQQIF